MSRTLANLHETLAARKDASEAEVRDVARRVADGEDVAPEDVIDVLDRSGKSLDDFTALVERIERRKSLFAKIDAAATVDQEHSKVEAAIQSHADEQEAFNRKWNAALAPLLVKREGIVARRLAASAAKSELLKTASPELIEKRDDLGRRRAAWKEDRQRLVETIQRVGGVVKQLDEVIRQQRTAEAREPRERDRANELARLEQLRASLAEHDALKSGLDAEEVEIREAMLKV